MKIDIKNSKHITPLSLSFYDLNNKNTYHLIIEMHIYENNCVCKGKHFF